MKVAERNRIQLTRVAGHGGIKGNEAANQMATTEPEIPSHQELARGFSGAG
jgi:ribonuclease HI